MRLPRNSCNWHSSICYSRDVLVNPSILGTHFCLRWTDSSIPLGLRSAARLQIVLIIVRVVWAQLIYKGGPLELERKGGRSGSLQSLAETFWGCWGLGCLTPHQLLLRLTTFLICINAWYLVQLYCCSPVLSKCRYDLDHHEVFILLDYFYANIWGFYYLILFWKQFQFILS